ncbi:MAG: peptidase M19 [Saprospiraceae bacterium]
MPYSIDIHCHPSLKPYGRSFSTSTPRKNTKDRSKRHSLWHYDPPQGLDIPLQKLIGMTTFSQSDFSALAYGNVRIVCASIYCVEDGLVNYNTLGTGELTDFFANLVSGIGRDRINFLQSNKDYFNELVNEYQYYKDLDGEIIPFKDDIKRKYVLVKNYSDLEEKMRKNEADPGIETIFVIITFEGAHHLFNSKDHIQSNDLITHEAEILQNITTIKSWDHRPFFITFGHHFYNGLCGHAESLRDFIQDLLTNQEPMMNTPMNDLGFKLVEALLDDTGGKRIHIDMKHMSYLTRIGYIRYLKTRYPDEYAAKKLPLIVSHGACNGLSSKENPVYHPGLEGTSKNMYVGDINFYDVEILEIARSGGIIGLQFDERRIGSKQYIKSLRKLFASRTERRHSNSKLLWNNIQHIVQLLDAHNLFAWDCIAIGTDNDGLIDPINLFWTAEDMDDMIQYIERHAYNFLSDPSTAFNVAANKITAAEAVQRIFQGNSFEFIKRYFR